MTYNILIADDERYTVEMVRFAFDDDRFNVDIVTDGSHALASLMNKDYHVLAIDMNMPGMDGLSAIGHIRRINPNISIFIMTGAPDSDQVKEALEKYDVYGVMSKPFDLDLFIETVEKGVKLREQKPDFSAN